MKKVIDKSRIMIIDDTVENLNLLNSLLTEQGYDVSLFPKAELALQALKINPPELILLDINMPGMNGFDFCKTLKADEKFSEIPVIFLSAMQNISDKLNAFKIGGVDYITKPFQFDEVLVRVKTHIKLRKQQQQLEENFQQLQVANKALEKSLDTLKRDEEAGRIVQFKLLPENHRKIADYEFEYYLQPSLYMSGDFVDFFDIDDNHAGFYMADVSGHGAASAFVTFLLKTFMSNYRKNYHENHDKSIITPNELLAQLSKTLYESKLDKYLTMFYGVINKSENSLTYANGGHFPFPFLVNDSKVEQISSKSVPVGLFSFVKYTNSTLSLPDNFTFTVFSDGILEILDEEDVKIQIEKLKQLVSTRDNGLKSLVDKLIPDKNAELLDDITILSVRKGK
jgi:phosphoserine phosphatase RsbU/P